MNTSFRYIANLVFATLVCFVTCGSPLHADFVTFNESTLEAMFIDLSVGDVFVEGDWQFEVIVDNGVFTVDNDFDPSLAVADDDVSFLQFGSEIEFTRIDGQNFDAISLESLGSFGEN